MTIETYYPEPYRPERSFGWSVAQYEQACSGTCGTRIHNGDVVMSVTSDAMLNSLEGFKKSTYICIACYDDLTARLTSQAHRMQHVLADARRRADTLR